MTAYPHTQYTRARIQQFVTDQPNLVEDTPLTTQQMQSEAFFQEHPELNEKIDLLYCFQNEEQVPALGFQQVDGEADEEEKFTLVYLDPSLEKAFKGALG